MRRASNRPQLMRARHGPPTQPVLGTLEPVHRGRLAGATRQVTRSRISEERLFAGHWAHHGR
jgi:hypothetical protein